MKDGEYGYESGNPPSCVTDEFHASDDAEPGSGVPVAVAPL